MPYQESRQNAGVYRLFSVLLAAFFIVLFNALTSAAEQGAELRVGVREVRPFCFIDEKQQPRGYSIDLWNIIADELNLKYSFASSDGISNTLQNMKDGKLHIAIGAITITEEREKIFDFSYSHFHTGLGIMTQAKPAPSVLSFLSSFFTTDRLSKIGGFFLFLLLSAHVIWLAERRGNYSFDRNYFPGIFEGMYWSIVTASTVGYGDYIPKSKLGKWLSVLIIIISLPLFGILVADLSSDITLHKMSSNINGPQDLDEKRVGVVKGSTSEEYMAREHRAILEGYTSSKELFSHLEEGALDAIVNDLPTLHYYANTEGKGKVKIVGKMFKKQHYAFLYPEDSRLEEPVNRTLLRLFENGTINTIQRKWFGEFGDG